MALLTRISSLVARPLRKTAVANTRQHLQLRCMSTEKSNITPQPDKVEEGKDETYGKWMTEIKVGKIDRFYLVWGGKYKSMDEVPAFVTQSVMERARNKARIKTNMTLGAMVLLGCLCMVISGKRAASQGQSMLTINQEFHRKYNEEKLKEENPEAKPNS